MNMLWELMEDEMLGFDVLFEEAPQKHQVLDDEDAENVSVADISDEEEEYSIFEETKRTEEMSDYDDEEEEEEIGAYNTKRKGKYEKENNETGRYLESDVPDCEDIEEEPYEQVEEILEMIEEKDAVLHEETEISFKKKVYEGQFHENATIYVKKDEIAEVNIVEYESPLIMKESHGQYVFEQIYIKNTAKSGVNAYDLTLQAMKDIDVEAEYSPEFNAMYIKRIDGIADGTDGKWWEYYIVDRSGNAKIGKDSIDKVVLKEGETIEWRLASEEPGGCGGVVEDRYKNDSIYGIKAMGLNDYIMPQLKPMTPYPIAS